MLGARRTTPGLLLEAEADVLPLNLHFQWVTANYFVGLFFHPVQDEISQFLLLSNSTTLCKPWEIVRLIGVILPLSPSPATFPFPPWACFTPDMQTVLPPEVLTNYSFFAYLLREYPFFTVLYTDCSKTAGPPLSVAAAVYVSKSSLTFTWKLATPLSHCCGCWIICHQHGIEVCRNPSEGPMCCLHRFLEFSPHDPEAAELL